MADKNPPTLEHQEPPIYYCWSYWLSNGEMREGCTPIEPANHNGWPDLNDYGWVYITIPLAVLFVSIFVVYLVCSKSSKKKTVQKQSLLLEDSDDSDVDSEPVPKSKWPRFHSHNGNGPIHAVPVRKSQAPKVEEFYTVVQMAKPDNNAAPNRKVAPRAGVTSPMQSGLYPKLSTARRQQSGPRGDEEVKVDGRRAFSKPHSSQPVPPPGNQYVNNPATTVRKQTRKPDPKEVEEYSSSSDEEELLARHDEHSDEENEE